MNKSDDSSNWTDMHEADYEEHNNWDSTSTVNWSIRKSSLIHNQESFKKKKYEEAE